MVFPAVLSYSSPFFEKGMEQPPKACKWEDLARQAAILGIGRENNFNPSFQLHPISTKLLAGKY